MSLKTSYSLIAPFYDAAVARATRAARQRSLAALPDDGGQVLLAGVGTGLDLPHLSPAPRYVGVDLNRSMLRRALPRADKLDFAPVQGDVQRLPFPEAAFDAAVLHLILAVVPQPERCLGEIARVVRPGGTVIVFDKFLRRGQPALLRRLANPLVRRVASRLDVVFEDVLATAPQFACEDDQPALGDGWFRLIRLRRR
ncbi:MAG: class I SAM-dependent methyltransferase [Azonexus sp.]|jgi:ubiquinone/menaquinone biosynthesis C-methylase UbiE|uniref:class I SAM-dependent methyltransferase n=1 Tax=Azonexus sp. TaxID=1872668 RepID=UPI002818F9BB|nr:class I SAM-dependent methyltransferase [Azonexus sp.]MDR0775626.1 class I SAM-dependent methyltransferase [Azonexus sp.]